MSCSEDHRGGGGGGVGGLDAAGCSSVLPGVEKFAALACGEQHGSWGNPFPFLANGLDEKGSCCLGIPHCLLSLPPPAPHCVLDSSLNSSISPSVKQQQQQQQQPVCLYSKLSQLQFLTRVFHSNLLGNFLCNESFHHPGGAVGNIHQGPAAAAAGVRHFMPHSTSAPEKLFLHLHPPPSAPCSVARFPNFQFPAAASAQHSGTCDHHRASKLDSCSLCQSRAASRVDVPMLNVSTPQLLLPAMGLPVLQRNPQCHLPATNSQRWTHKEKPQPEWLGLPPFQEVADNNVSSSTRVYGEQSAAVAAAAVHVDLDSPQSSNVSLCGPLQDMRSGQRNRVKGQWSLAEDKSLVKLVRQYGTRRWSLIATFMANRSGKQCRERWVNHLQPDIRKEGWTKEEEELLVQAHSYFGNKWSAIAKMLPGRTDNSIKNHWHAALRKKDRHGKLRSNLLREYIQQTMAKADSPASQEET